VPPAIFAVEWPKPKKMGDVERRGLIYHGGSIEKMGHDELMLVNAHHGEHDLQKTRNNLLKWQAGAYAEWSATVGWLGKTEWDALVTGKQPAATQKEWAQAATIDVLKTSNGALKKVVGQCMATEVHDAKIIEKGLAVHVADQMLSANDNKPFIAKIAQQIQTGKQPNQSFGTEMVSHLCHNLYGRPPEKCL
jgi:hypothetical protein